MADMTTQNDIKAEEKTYGGFVTVVKWSVSILFLIVMLLIVIIS